MGPPIQLTREALIVPDVQSTVPNELDVDKWGGASYWFSHAGVASGAASGSVGGGGGSVGSSHPSFLVQSLLLVLGTIAFGFQQGSSKVFEGP